MNRDQAEETLLTEALLGNAAAIDLCQRLFRVSQVLDDMIDKDRPIGPGDITTAFWDALVEIPANPFYRQHFNHLHPIIAASFIDWEDATRMEQSEDTHGRSIAFVLRDTIGQVIIHCALLIGGKTHASTWSVKIRKHIMNEPLGDYLAELKK